MVGTATLDKDLTGVISDTIDRASMNVDPLTGLDLFSYGVAATENFLDEKVADATFMHVKSLSELEINAKKQTEKIVESLKKGELKFEDIGNYIIDVLSGAEKPDASKFAAYVSMLDAVVDIQTLYHTTYRATTLSQPMYNLDLPSQISARISNKLKLLRQAINHSGDTISVQPHLSISTGTYFALIGEAAFFCLKAVEQPKDNPLVPYLALIPIWWGGKAVITGLKDSYAEQKHIIYDTIRKAAQSADMHLLNKP